MGISAEKAMRGLELKASQKAAETELFKRIYGFKGDPLGYVMYAFPWGRPGTILHDKAGPDKWQVDILNEIKEKYGAGDRDPVRIAVASGHGIGKGALSAWVTLWFMSTKEYPQIVVTAGTKNQLETKTWRELSKWHNLSINKHWFKWTAEKFKLADPLAESTWFAACIPWRKEKADSFQGTHDRFVLIVFDEASAVDDVIWEATNGAMTTPGALWLTLGNPVRGEGAFRECFGRFRHRWITRQIDSRTARMTDKTELQRWVDDYGEDSDYVRVRVKGMFPRASNTQFIDIGVVEAAMARKNGIDMYRHAPLTIGVDVARFGDDQTVLTARQGIHIHEIRRYRELDVMQVASQVMLMEDEYSQASPVRMSFVDNVGIGAGVVDRLSQMGRRVIGVNGGQSPTQQNKFFNKRAEMWFLMREWLKAGGDLPDDKELAEDLVAPMYGFTASEKVQLEKKDDIKRRGLASPDSGDSLALTFAFPQMAAGMGIAPRMRHDEDDEYEYDRSTAGRRMVSVTGY